MSQDQQDKPSDRGRSHDRFEFYYYERIGDFYYLRITRFSLYLIIVLGVAALIFFSLWSGGGRPADVDVRITTPNSSPYPTPSPGVKPPPSFPPPAGQGPSARTPAPRRSPSPFPTPSAPPAQTPRPDPMRPPSPPGPAG